MVIRSMHGQQSAQQKKQSPSNKAHADTSLSTNAILQLQKTIGNRAVQRMISQQPVIQAAFGFRNMEMVQGFAKQNYAKVKEFMQTAQTSDDEILKNSLEWLENGNLELFIATKTHDFSERAAWLGQKGQRACFLFNFYEKSIPNPPYQQKRDDPGYNIICLPKENMAVTTGNSIYLQEPRKWSYEDFEIAIKHEVQHKADRHTFGHSDYKLVMFKTEFRAHRVQGMEMSPQKLRDYILDTYDMRELYKDKEEDWFKTEVDRFIQDPDFVNPTNSLPLQLVYDALSEVVDGPDKNQGYQDCLEHIPKLDPDSARLVLQHSASDVNKVKKMSEKLYKMIENRANGLKADWEPVLATAPHQESQESLAKSMPVLDEQQALLDLFEKVPEKIYSKASSEGTQIREYAAKIQKFESNIKGAWEEVYLNSAAYYKFFSALGHFHKALYGKKELAEIEEQTESYDTDYGQFKLLDTAKFWAMNDTIEDAIKKMPENGKAVEAYETMKTQMRVYRSQVPVVEGFRQLHVKISGGS